METTLILVTFLFPLSLAIIMFGLGLSLTTADFFRVLKYPKSAIIGLLCQILILPVLGLLICHLFKLSYSASIGVMILAASPGGITANLFSHLANGDIALNLTLTAVNSILAAFTLPLIVHFSFSYFALDTKTDVGLQFTKALEVFAIVIVPVVLGMFLNKYNPNFSKRSEKLVKIFSFIVLILIIVSAIYQQRDQLMVSFSEIGLAMFTFNLLSMGIGYGLPKLLNVSKREAIAIAMEVGIHNSTLAIYICINILQSFSFALPAAIYSIVMFFNAGLFSFYLVSMSALRKNPSE